MERGVAEVLRDALALPPEVRAALIDSLISGLDQTVDAAGEEAWREEIYRRLRRSTAGPFSSFRGKKRAAASGLDWSSEQRIRSNSPFRFGRGRSSHRMVSAAQCAGDTIR